MKTLIASDGAMLTSDSAAVRLRKDDHWARETGRDDAGIADTLWMPAEN